MQRMINVTGQTADKPSVVDSFRASLDDVAEIARALSHYCSSIEDLVGVVELALAHDAQLHFLMAIMKKAAEKKK